jgi:hypothetical protein
MECFVDRTEGKAESLGRAMDFLKEHNIDRNEKFVKEFDFGLLTYAVVVEKGTAVPGGNTNRVGGEGRGGRGMRQRGSVSRKGMGSRKVKSRRRRENGSGKGVRSRKSNVGSRSRGNVLWGSEGSRTAVGILGEGGRVVMLNDKRRNNKKKVPAW